MHVMVWKIHLMNVNSKGLHCASVRCVCLLCSTTPKDIPIALVQPQGAVRTVTWGWKVRDMHSGRVLLSQWLAVMQPARIYARWVSKLLQT